MHHPDRVRRLVLTEAMLGRLPGAEDFLRDGPPWWFGFHAVPDLAESVLTGHEGSYIDWFLTTGTRGRGVPAHLRTAFVNAYTGAAALLPPSRTTERCLRADVRSRRPPPQPDCGCRRWPSGHIRSVTSSRGSCDPAPTI
ncbi:hypothetical protein [Nocardia brasiliensis]|uniref:hypothetical protein n=1 Tax=Nocardia brasiliensis TaxID=37326 RepID=UPI002453C4D2|nr:hypothetical protein [Nocardia brasiliensis]